MKVAGQITLYHACKVSGVVTALQTRQNESYFSLIKFTSVYLIIPYRLFLFINPDTGYYPTTTLNMYVQ